MDIVLNQIAIWAPCGAKKLNIRKTQIGEKYRQPSGVVYQTSVKPLIRYAKDYEIKEVGFSLFLRTDCEDAAKVEAALDYYASQITKEYALRATANVSNTIFEYTPYIFDPTQTLIAEAK